MFTDRFIKIPIQVYDKELAELTGKEPDYTDSWMKINPMEISEYKPTVTEKDGHETDCTYIVMKNGSGFYCYLIPEDFEKILNSKDSI